MQRGFLYPRTLTGSARRAAGFLRVKPGWRSNVAQAPLAVLCARKWEADQAQDKPASDCALVDRINVACRASVAGQADAHTGLVLTEMW